MVPQICDIKLTGGKKLQVREVSDYFFSRDDSMISGLRSHCSGSSCQISGGQKDQEIYSIISVKTFQLGASCSKHDEQQSITNIFGKESSNIMALSSMLCLTFFFK